MAGQSTVQINREMLDRMVEQLQHQTDCPLWAVAHSDAVKAISLDRPVPFGPRGRLVHRIFAITGKGRASLLALWIIGFAVVVRWWFGAALAKQVPAEGVFVGFGAGSEVQLFEKFETDLAGRAIRITNNDPRTFGRISKPMLGNLLRHLWVACGSVYRGLRKSERAVLGDSFCIWMTVSAMRMGVYTFARAWAEQLPATVEQVVFVSVDVECFAVVDGRRPDQHYAIEYWQHGLHYRSLLIPQVDRIVALNYPEGRHMHRLSGSPFRVFDAPRLSSEDPHTAVLLLASVYTAAGFDKKDHIALLKHLFAWAKSCGLFVVIRPHPREDPSFWREYFPDLYIDRKSVLFSDCVERWRPSLVVSWFSTTLLDALRFGVAPVLLIEGSAAFLHDLVLPLDIVALRWPEDQEMMEIMIQDRTDYQHWVDRRWREVFTPDGENYPFNNRNQVACEGLVR